MAGARISRAGRGRDYAARAVRYALDVEAGRLEACRWVRLACKRFLDDLARVADPAYRYTFDFERAGRVCRLLEQLPHTKGEWAVTVRGRDNRIRLEPWQIFIYCAVFGWIHKASRARRFRIAYIAIPRKNGKSILAAGTGLYMLACDGEFGAEVYAGATCQRQALEVFRPAKHMVERTERLRETFGIKVGSKNLAILANGSRFEPVVGNPGDGASPSCALVDEYHEHRTDQLVDAMRTGMGARRQPLLWIITTAGVTIEGPCYDLQRDVEKMLEGTLDRDELFGIIFTIDDDDWTSEAALRKANPNFGVSVSREFLLSEQAAAVQNSRKQNIFKTKHLNIWCGSLTAFFNSEKWRALGDRALRMEDFAGQPAWDGCDLAFTTDLCARVRVFRRDLDGQAHYYAFGRYYLPRDKAEDPQNQHYQRWVDEGYLCAIDGPTVDLAVLRGELLAEAERFDLRAVAFDPWAAVETQQELQRELGEERVVSVPMQTKYLSYPMKALEALILEGRIHHDGDPVLAWMIGNVIAKADANDNVFPRKERPENKIDGAVALIMALSRALTDAGEQFREYTGF